MYASTISARSTSSRSTSSFSTSVRSRSNGPWKTSRSRSMVAARTGERLRGGSDAHGAADIRHRLGGERAGALGALGQGLLERRLVGADLGIALADRCQVVDHRLGHGGFERAVALAVELALHLFRRAAADHREDVDQVAHAGLVG